MNKKALVLLVAGMLSAPVAVDAGSSTYLLIPGVPGESVRDRFLGWIELDSVSVGVSNGLCSGFTVTKPLDTASPLLSASALSRVIYPTMTAKSIKDGEGQTAFLTYTLSNVSVTSISVKVSASAVIEAVTFLPEVVSTTYYPQDAKGAFGPAVESTVTCKYK